MQAAGLGQGREIHGTQGSWSGRREIETPRGRSLASMEPLGWRSEEHRGEEMETSWKMSAGHQEGARLDT